MRGLVILTMLAAAAATSLQVSGASAQQTGADVLGTGNLFLANCEKPVTEGRLGYCYGYLRGMLEATAASTIAIQVTQQMPTRDLFCLPPVGVDVTQVRDVFTNWLRAHPADRHQPTSALFQVAMRMAFPCQR